MKLRNGHLAVVDRRKLVEYLLNPAHPGNGGKADFFGALGFSAASPDDLARELCTVALDGEVVGESRSAHGEKYVVDGRLPAHTGTESPRLVRTIWVIDAGRDAPRLVTAYPGKEGISR